MPITPADPPQLHLVTVPVDRIDWRKTESHADTVRAAQYAASRGDHDFARFSADVARILNEVAMLKDPTDRLLAAEKARRSLADWPAMHYGYRAKEVHEILGSLDEVIGGLRAAAGLSRFELSLSATTAPPMPDTMLPPPDQTQLVEQLLTAARLAPEPADKMSLLQTVVGVVDHVTGGTPDSWSTAMRQLALDAIAEEQRIDTAYTALRDKMLAAASRLVATADVRGLERLRSSLTSEDVRLGQRRPGELIGLAAAIDASLATAHRNRLAHDQWLLRRDRALKYQRDTNPLVGALAAAQRDLDDVRALAGPAPVRLRPLVADLGRAARMLSRFDAPAEMAAIHSLFRTASDLALNAVQLRLAAVEAADLEVARRASSAAAGALLLLARAKADLEAALRPPVMASAQ
jgi:hypothetical protein